MRIFIDIAHPAYFLFFRNFIEIMTGRSHDFLISAKDKDVTLDLFNHYSIKFVNRGKSASSFLSKGVKILSADLSLYRKVKRFNPDLILSFSSPVAAHLSFLLHKPCITIEDTESAGLVHRSYLPFSNIVITPACFEKRFGKKHIEFDSYKELAYLHPNYFLQEKEVSSILGIKNDEKYIVIRFVSHRAVHDRGIACISDEYKIELVRQLSGLVKVFLTSEEKLPPSLEKFRVAFPPWYIHNVVADATLLFGESSTMAAEAAVLGVPAIFIDSNGRGYTNELEKKYGLVYNFKPTIEGMQNALRKAIEILSMQDRQDIFQKRREELLYEKIDPTAFFIWFVEGYPHSVEVMKRNPDYQYKFK